MSPVIVPARAGCAVSVSEGEHVRVTTPRGGQAADFFAYNAHNVAEWLSPMHTWVSTYSIKPREGDTIRSRFRRPMLRLSEDGAGGCHDMMIAACDQVRYEEFGVEGPHPSCAENLMVSMRRLGHQIDVVPQPINFFTNTVVDAEAKLTSPPNPVPPGAYVELQALMDLICIVSSCPFDLNREGWTINAACGPTELLVEVR